MSETWVTKQLLPDLQAVRAVTFSGEKVVLINFEYDLRLSLPEMWQLLAAKERTIIKISKLSVAKFRTLTNRTSKRLRV